MNKQPRSSNWILHPPPNMTPSLLHNLLLPIRRAPHEQILPPIKPGLPIPRIRTRHNAPGLFQYNPPGRHVPDPAASLPIHVDRPVRDRAHVQRRRAQRADALHHGPAILLRCSEGVKQIRFDGPVGPLTLIPPFHGHQGVLEPC